MKRNLLAILLCLLTGSLFAQTTFTGNLQNGDPTFNRPNEGAPPTSFSAFQNVRYDVYPVTITSTGLITVSVTSSFDNFVILYSPDGFFPAIPLTNALVANDDFIGQDAGFSYDITTTGTYYLVVSSFKNNVSGPYSATVSSGAVLPLKLVSFTGTKTTGNKNLIKWTSTEESNLSHYQLQKSTNNIIFQDVANALIMATNNSLGASYQFIDENFATGNQFYRLKITEKSGLVTYSSILVIKQSNAGTILSAFPNPTTDFLQVEMKNMQGKQAAIAVVNASGIVVLKGQYRFSSFSYLKLPVTNLQAGTYYLKISANDTETLVSFVKQ